MKFAELIAAIEKFLNDILGNVIPGGILLVGLIYFNVHFSMGFSAIDWDNGGLVLVLVILAYILGHVVDELFQTVRALIKPRSKNDIESQSKRLFRAWVNYRLIRTDFCKSGQIVDKVFDEEDDSDLRGIAMTMSSEATFLSRKFKFIELFCRGSATAILLLIIYSIFSVDDLETEAVMIWVLLFIVAVLLFRRAGSFYNRSATACYDCVMASILTGQYETPQDVPQLSEK